VTTAVGVRVRAPALGRVAAVLALGSAAVHLLLLDATSLGALVMVGMAVACLPCARQLWRAPGAGAWGVVAAVDAAMLALHAQMLAGVHHASSLMWLGLVLVVAQLAVAGAAALRR
jgi:hypothetical protein